MQGTVKANLFLHQQKQLCVELDSFSPETILSQLADEVREHIEIDQSIHISIIYQSEISSLLRVLPLVYHYI